MSSMINNFNRLAIGKRAKSDQVEITRPDHKPDDEALERHAARVQAWQALTFYAEAYRREQWRKRREEIENDTTGKSYTWKPTRPARA